MHVASDLAQAIGNTPLIRLRQASEDTGCEIYGKAEFMNPGQSVKDRAALFIIKDAIAKGTLKPGGTIVEGTAGNTGIGLALVGASMGFKTVIVIPETQSQEKKDMLRLAGAELVQVPAAPYRNPNNFVRYSERLANELARTTNEGVIWANQFDNVANRQAHIETTGPEIWEQTGGKVDGFCCSVGSGGTLAGIGMSLQPKGVKIALADPDGAALHSYYTTGELVAEGGSIAEGIGQVRITKNLEGFTPDFSYNISDAEALPMCSTCYRTKACAWALPRGSTLPVLCAWPATWDPEKPSLPYCAISARGISQSCSILTSCATRVCRCQAGLTVRLFRSPAFSKINDIADESGSGGADLSPAVGRRRFCPNGSDAGNRPVGKRCHPGRSRRRRTDKHRHGTGNPAFAHHNVSCPV